MKRESSALTATIFTIFPDLFPGVLGESIAGSALKNNIWNLKTVNLRDFGVTRHKNVDDAPYGGGSGMVMRPDVIGAAIDDFLKSVSSASLAESVDNKASCDPQKESSQPKFIYMSPRGTPLTQSRVIELSDYRNLAILCGRFEGIDQRIIDEYDMEEVSIGDYILSGGELAAMVMLDAIIRTLPNAIGDNESLREESFGINFDTDTPNISKSARLLEYPHYTRPQKWRGRSVPQILLSGDHQKIAHWRCQESLKLTRQRRPDLLDE